jgi:hypothetical protein
LFLLIVQVVAQKLLLLPWFVFCHYERNIAKQLFLSIVQAVRKKNLFFFKRVTQSIYLIFKDMVGLEDFIHVKIENPIII